MHESCHVTDIQIWTGLMNPNLNKCLNETCNGELLWADNSAVDFHTQEIGAKYHSDNRDVGTWTCFRFKAPDLKFGDALCHYKHSFMCQRYV